MIGGRITVEVVQDGTPPNETYRFAVDWTKSEASPKDVANVLRIAARGLERQEPDDA